MNVSDLIGLLEKQPANQEVKISCNDGKSEYKEPSFIELGSDFIAIMFEEKTNEQTK